MLTNRLSDEEREFEMLTWRAQKRGAQVIAHDQLAQFTATIAEQEAILAAAQARRSVTPVG